MVAASDVRVMRWVSTALFLGAGLFALVGLGVLAGWGWYLTRHPFHPVLVLLAAMPFGVTGLLWWEGRNAREKVRRALDDRT